VSAAVEKTVQAAKGEQRSALLLSFTGIEIDGARLKMPAKVSAVDRRPRDGRRSGQINGILASETLTHRLDTGISKVAERYSGFADFLGMAKSAVLKRMSRFSEMM
jgi:hypothetical protein